MALPINLLFVLVLVAGAICLQVFLSKKQNRWLGLILPFIAFAYSLLMVFSVAVTPHMTGWEVFGAIASVFFIANIATVILLGIYWGCRESLKRKKALEKMNIMDLE
ncbi:MAG: hypothetical protein ACK5JF_02565 [Oscillospiraceae bacterium]